jgi:hypothetical protein
MLSNFMANKKVELKINDLFSNFNTRKLNKEKINSMANR